MSFAISNLSQMPMTRDNIFLYGDAGVGKSVFACSSQKRRTFVMNIEDGWKSARTWRGTPDGVFPPVQVPLIDVTSRIETGEHFLAAYNYLLQNHSKYQVVVMDTATELQKVLMRGLLKKRNKVIPEIQDWGMVLNQLEFFFAEMRKLPLTKIILGHEVSKFSPNTGFNMFSPSFQGAFKTDFARQFDEIWRIMMVQQQVRAADNSISTITHRWIQTSPDQNTVCKTRSNALAFYELPILDAMLLKMQGE